MVSHSVATSGPSPRHATVKKTQPNLISNSIGGNNSDAKDDATKALTVFTSGSSAFRTRNIMESYTPMVPPSLNANTANGASSCSSWTRSFKYSNCSPNALLSNAHTANDWSSSSLWMRSINYNNRNSNTPLSNTNTADDAASSSSWMQSVNYNSHNSNRIHRKFIRGPVTRLETIWESIWESEPYFVPQAKDNEATAKSD
ncbi:hypothetical protein BCR41DRAFT_366782 [Lobosporangium transversale]|uniref:Uncharacterized protein n=1 Tax=Lobosporangium transversale TaxID=64571 RepID=A0A1Y2G9T4_9FUNG|nr:hypothetical protein BCR41DRAFT_374550 [Lobosporangium transversale]XP_021886809.1 hypothetical protein BCR41DRAFT_366782 [Lobosporangium transversale]ORZ05114.1 hypothetical protein BCR41DRAFT_374550 [Lobosporangium transversale]ORZ29136.1 hypothetical protein BCR41DRAFT_366782 [Lobosporangium transversale]|eukprot:XP_021876889.1 hypothetical protein BCR41DRAFT_374550 [Lobosporangium transversale]